MGKWLPKNKDKLEGFMGFYINYSDVYKNGDSVDNIFQVIVEKITKKMKMKYPKMNEVLEWDGDDLIFLKNSQVNLIMGGDDTRLAIFVIIPEGMFNAGLAKRNIIHYANRLEEILNEEYPGKVKRYEEVR